MGAKFHSISISVSIVLFKHSRRDIQDLLGLLLHSEAIGNIYLVNNGGSEWVESLAGSKIFPISGHGNIGFGAGHNLALRHNTFGSSKFHLICNPDISFSTTALNQLLSLVHARSEVLFIPNVCNIDGTRQDCCKLLPSPLNLFARRFFPALGRRLDSRYLLANAVFTKEFFAPSLSGCFMLCRAEALVNVGGFDERYFMYMEDVDLSRRLAYFGGSMYLPSVQIFHGFQKGSYKNIRLLKYHIHSAIKYFNKWGWIVDPSRSHLNRRCLLALPLKSYEQE